MGNIFCCIGAIFCCMGAIFCCMGAIFCCMGTIFCGMGPHLAYIQQILHMLHVAGRGNMPRLGEPGGSGVTCPG